MKTIGYTDKAKESKNTDSDRIYAKQMFHKITKTMTYHVKVGYLGSFSGYLQNPYDIDYKKTQFKWIRVKKECFDSYVSFLRTNNKLHLRSAERNMV